MLRHPQWESVEPFLYQHVALVVVAPATDEDDVVVVFTTPTALWHDVVHRQMRARPAVRAHPVGSAR